MRQILLALCACALLAPPVLAQGQEAPSPDQGLAGPAAAAPGGAGAVTDPRAARKSQMKVLHANCRAQGVDQGLRGRPLRQAISDCIVKARPELAGRMKCRMEGLDKNLRKDDLRTYVRACIRKNR